MTTRSADLARPLAAARREPVALELAGVFLSLTGLLVGSAIVTLAPEDSTRNLANVAGGVGRRFAEGLTLSLGAGAYLFAVFPILWGLECIRGRRPSSWGRKALMVPVLAGFLAVLSSLLFRRFPAPGVWRSGPGGYVGVAFGHVLFRLVGRAASLLAGGLAVASLLLATDVRLSGLARRVRAARGRGARGPTAEGSDAAGGATAAASIPGFEDGLDGEMPDGPGGAPHADLEALAAFGHGDDDLDLAQASSTAVAEAPPAGRSAAPAEAPAPAPRPRPRKAPPRLAGDYEFPPTTLLERSEPTDPEKVRAEIERNAAVLVATLRSFGVESRVVSERRGPVITFYELALDAGTRVSRVAGLDKDLAVALKSESVRVVAPIPGKDTIGIEVPNTIRDAVRLLDLIDEAQERAARRAIPLFLGKDALGEPIVEDLAAMPHMLIAGTTGSGKSVCVSSVLLSVLLTRTPDEVKFVLIDPKQVELSFFAGIPHLLTPVVTNMKKASQILEWAVSKMEQRYDLLLKCGVRNIGGYNAQGAERLATVRAEHGLDETDAPELMPYLVLVVDELADLMLQHGKDVEGAIIRLAAKSRAVGIHLILATQRPSVDVITGLIKSNMPMRVAFKVASLIDSRVILDHKGAEKLLGKGDMLFIPPGTSNLKRAQGTYISDAEVKNLVEFVKERAGPAEYQDILDESGEGLGDPNDEDDLYDDAVRAVLATKLGSASMLQRRFGIGYTRASRLIDMMCDHKVVGPHKGSKARELLVTLEEWEAVHAAKAGGPPAGPTPAEMSERAEAAALADVELGDSDEDDGIESKASSKGAQGVSSPWD